MPAPMSFELLQMLCVPNLFSRYSFYVLPVLFYYQSQKNNSLMMQKNNDDFWKWAWYFSARLHCTALSLCQGSGWWGWRVLLPNLCSPPKPMKLIYSSPTKQSISFFHSLSHALSLVCQDLYPSSRSPYKMKHGNSCIHSWSTSCDLLSKET